MASPEARAPDRQAPAETGSRRAGGMSAAPAPPLVLASTSPQRRAILEQLAIPFEVVAPGYEELPGVDPVRHAAGKARSVDGGDRPVLGSTRWSSAAAS